MDRTVTPAHNTGPPAGASQPISIEAIRIQLEKILTSQRFVHSDRMARFFRFVVEQTIQGRTDQLKESVIGMEVFAKKASFDPRTGTIVRVKLPVTFGWQNLGASDVRPLIHRDLDF